MSPMTALHVNACFRSATRLASCGVLIDLYAAKFSREGTPMSFKSLRHNWFSNVRHDLLAGLVVALALISEAIAFSIIAGVDPKVGLYASFSIATLMSTAIEN